MVQVINTGGNLGSRLGAAVGSGIASTLPKEVERMRLSQGLKDLGKMENASPFERFAALAGIPGITPQMIESGAELLKQQRMRKAYGQSQGSQGQSGQMGQQPQPGQDFRDVQFGQTGESPMVPASQSQAALQPGSTEQQALTNPPSAFQHPGDEKYQPALPWNQQMQDSAINEAFDTGKAENLNEAMNYANMQRELYEKAPEKERARLNYNREIDQNTEELFRNELEQRLQKKGEKTFEDVPGELQLSLIKKAQNDVATGKMTPKQASEFYSQSALDLVKSFNIAKKNANPDILDMVNPKKKLERMKSLQVTADQFEKLGAGDYYYNFLTNKGKDEQGNNLGMGLSPGMAAMIQYPISQSVEKIISEAKFPTFGYDNIQKETNRIADEVLNNMTPNDSILSIARQLKDRQPSFDETAFFDYIRANPNKWNFNPRLTREVQTGVSDVLPNWGDIFLIPANMKITPAHRSRK